jgi:hypothetical protein
VRHRLQPSVDSEIEDSAVQLRGWATRKQQKPRTPSIPNAAWSRACEEARIYASTGDWSQATPRHFVALYDTLHHKIYGVSCEELTPQGRAKVTFAATRVLKVQFDGDANAFAEFLRWTWMREAERERRRRESGFGGGVRIGPWLQFGGTLLTDYRLAVVRAVR